MKQLKDYLHLYLGCQCIIEEQIWCLWKISQDNAYLKNDARMATRCYQIYKIKPILRPLSDMTEEECTECGFKNKQCLDDWLSMPKQVEGWPLMIEIRYLPVLVYKHFDLFGLIEAGLAIDRTALL